MIDGQSSGASKSPEAIQAFALITGASSGIGASFARLLAGRQRNLVLIARSADKLEALKTELSGKYPCRIEIIQQDLSVPGAASAVAQKLATLGVEINLLVNNAGFGAQGEFWQLPLERQTEMLRLNIGALTELSYLLLPAMIRRQGGGIINISSTAGFQPVPYLSVYAATKAYVTSLSMALAEEVRPYGVKVVALCPGATDTQFFAAGRFETINFAGGLQSPDDVAEIGLQALAEGHSLSVTRRYNRILIFAQRFVSRAFAARKAGDLFRPRPLQR